MAKTKSAARKKDNARAKQRKKRTSMRNATGTESRNANRNANRKAALKKQNIQKKKPLPIEATPEPALAEALHLAAAFPDGLHASVMETIEKEPLPKRWKMPFIPIGTLAAAVVVLILLLANGVIGPGFAGQGSAKGNDNASEPNKAPEAAFNSYKETTESSAASSPVSEDDFSVTDYQKESEALVKANRATARSICLTVYAEGITPDIISRDTDGMFESETVDNVIYYNAADRDDLLSFLAVEGLHYSIYNGDATGKTVAVVFPAANE